MTAQNRESPVLILPENPELVEQLRRKLAEYNDRVENYHTQHPNQHPRLIDRMLAIEICKARILTQLLEERHVVAWDASKKLMEELRLKDEGSMPAFADAWVQAWPVIRDYCETGGANLQSGTGLQ